MNTFNWPSPSVSRTGSIARTTGTARATANHGEIPCRRATGATSHQVTSPTTTVEALSADPDETFPADWEAQLDRWERPRPDEIWVLRPDAHVAAVLTRPADVLPAVSRLLARPVPVPA